MTRFEITGLRFFIVALAYLLTLTVDASAQNDEFRIFRDVDLYGSDISIIRGTTLASCQSACRRLNECNAFTYNTQHRWCFLKASGTQVRSTRTAVSGRKIRRTDFSFASEKDSIQLIQKQLKEIGLYDGQIDGIVGPKTRRAIQSFRAINPDIKGDDLTTIINYFTQSRIAEAGDTDSVISITNNFARVPLIEGKLPPAPTKPVLSQATRNTDVLTFLESGYKNARYVHSIIADSGIENHGLFSNIDVSTNETSIFTLLVGIDKYTFISSLQTPERDVREVSAALRSRGTRADESINPNKVEFLERLADTGKKARGKTLIVYIASHGVTINADSAILFEDAQPEKISSNDYITTSEITEVLKTHGVRHSIILFDACRNVLQKEPPEASQDFLRGKSTEAVRGISIASSSFRRAAMTSYAVGYATSNGDYALDGDLNSPYAIALAKTFRSSDTISEALMKTRFAVLEATSNKQDPEIQIRLASDIKFDEGSGETVSSNLGNCVEEHCQIKYIPLRVENVEKFFRIARSFEGRLFDGDNYLAVGGVSKFPTYTILLNEADIRMIREFCGEAISRIDVRHIALYVAERIKNSTASKMFPERRKEKRCDDVFLRTEWHSTDTSLDGFAKDLDGDGFREHFSVVHSRYGASLIITSERYEESNDYWIKQPYDLHAGWEFYGPSFLDINQDGIYDVHITAGGMIGDETHIILDGSRIMKKIEEGRGTVPRPHTHEIANGEHEMRKWFDAETILGELGPVTLWIDNCWKQLEVFQENKIRCVGSDSYSSQYRKNIISEKVFEFRIGSIRLLPRYGESSDNVTLINPVWRLYQ